MSQAERAHNVKASSSHASESTKKTHSVENPQNSVVELQQLIGNQQTLSLLNSGRLEPDLALRLQRSLGNQATARLTQDHRVSAPIIQRYTQVQDNGPNGMKGKLSSGRNIFLSEDTKHLFATDEKIAESQSLLGEIGDETGFPSGLSSFIRLDKGAALAWDGKTYYEVIPKFTFNSKFTEENFNENGGQGGHYHSRIAAASRPGGKDSMQAGLPAKALEYEAQAQRMTQLAERLGTVADRQEMLGGAQTALRFADEIRLILPTLPTDRMPIWADCSKASALVTGASTSDRGRKALFNQGEDKKMAVGQEDPSVKYKGHANKLAHELYRVQIVYFMSRPENKIYLVEGVHYTADGTLTAPGSLAHAKQLYGQLKGDGKARFDQEARINEFANPDIGHAYAMATEPEMPGFQKVNNREPWNQHWAGVIMKDGADNITMEGYALGQLDQKLSGIEQAEIVYRNWVFGMYGTAQADHTFHREHLATGTHGSHATTMSVMSTE